MSIQANYLCPLCRKVLNLTDRAFRCDNNHSFDQAKQGYVNLLPVQYKHSKAPGDNKEMVIARRAFLDKGFYQPLVDKMLELYNKYGEVNGPVLDAGCGEGFYTHQHKNVTNKVYGVDISKEMIKVAAKRYTQCHFSVGTLSKLSFSDNNFDWILSVYAPILEKEFTRILKKEGYLLTVTPAEKHLYELKQLIYKQANKHDESRSPIEHLTLIEEQKTTYPMHFKNSDDVLNLLSMTPFAFKTSQELIAQIKTMKEFTCQADFILRLYKKQT